MTGARMPSRRVADRSTGGQTPFYRTVPKRGFKNPCVVAVGGGV